MLFLSTGGAKKIPYEPLLSVEGTTLKLIPIFVQLAIPPKGRLDVWLLACEAYVSDARVSLWSIIDLFKGLGARRKFHVVFDPYPVGRAGSYAV